MKASWNFLFADDTNWWLTQAHLCIHRLLFCPFPSMDSVPQMDLAIFSPANIVSTLARACSIVQCHQHESYTKDLCRSDSSQLEHIRSSSGGINSTRLSVSRQRPKCLFEELINHQFDMVSFLEVWSLVLLTHISSIISGAWSYLKSHNIQTEISAAMRHTFVWPCSWLVMVVLYKHVWSQRASLLLQVISVLWMISKRVSHFVRIF